MGFDHIHKTADNPVRINRRITKEANRYRFHTERCNTVEYQGANPQRVSTEIIIEIKQSYPGQMASNPFIESHRMCKVFPLGNDFLIENGHFRLKH